MTQISRHFGDRYFIAMAVIPLVFALGLGIFAIASCAAVAVTFIIGPRKFAYDYLPQASAAATWTGIYILGRYLLHLT
jgi:hypothetical protein